MSYAVIIQMCQENQASRMICFAFMRPDGPKDNTLSIRRIIDISLTLHCPIWGFQFEVYVRLAFPAIGQSSFIRFYRCNARTVEYLYHHLMMMYHHHTKHSLRASALLTLVLTLKLISFLHTSGSFCTGLHSLSCCPHATSKEHSAAQMKPTEQRTICWANQHIRQQNHWTRFQKCSFSRIIEIRVERNN